MVSNIENDKWIDIHIGLSVSSVYIVEVKKEMKEYADELGWEIEVDKEGHVNKDGGRLYNIDIFPKGRKISPEELRKNNDKIRGFAYSILSNILYKDWSREELLEKS